MERVDLESLRPAWEALARTSGTLPTQTPAWMLPAASLPRSGPLVVETVTRDGRLVGLAPMAASRGCLGLLGVDQLFEPCDLLVADEQAREDLCRALLRRGRPLVLQRLPVASPTAATLTRLVAPRGRVVTRAEAGSPYLDLDDRWTTLGGGLSSRRRSDLRRALRRAEQRGEVGVRLLRPTPQEVPAVLDEAFAVEATGWKGLAGTPAAMQICVEWDRRLWLLKIGYDPAFSPCSPGLLLLAHVVQHAAEEGLSGVEFLGDDEDWLLPWTSGVRERASVVAVPGDVRALRGVATLAAPHVQKRVARTRGELTERLAERLRSSYVVGATLPEALEVERGYSSHDRPTVLGVWHREGELAATVGEQYAACVDALAGRADAQVSVKLPGIGRDVSVLSTLLERAKTAGVGLHLDAMAETDQEATLAAVTQLAPGAAGRLGCTLPGRWERSTTDAATVGGLAVGVRVVKGEWPAAEGPDQDLRQGFLGVVEALCASGPPRVQLATHDADLLEEAVRMLARAGLPAEHQVLWGMHAQPAVRVAARHGVPTRIFVPFGHGRVPYPLRQVHRRPDHAVRLVRDLVQRSRF